MAIYHLTANVVSRARGQSAVAAAAYRMGATLRDQRYGVTHNYAGKRGVSHAEIIAPDGAPAWVGDRQELWNRVEARELRKDSQLARLIEIALPVELTGAERIALMRDFVTVELVAKGMIADFCIRGGDTNNPHAHLLLTLRSVTPGGFGPKERSWNGKAALNEWRAAWALRTNEHLAYAGHAVRIDHRTLAEQQIELQPGRRIGVARVRHADGTLPPHLSARILEQQQIARANGELILEDPTVALRALTHQRTTFTHDELARYLRSRTHDEVQFAAVLAAVTESSELVALAPVRGQATFTSRDMIEAEKSLMRRTASMTGRRGHGLAADNHEVAAATATLSEAGRRAFDYLVSEGDAKALPVTAAMKAPLLMAAHRAWEAAGWVVRGAAPSSKAASNLEILTGIRSQSLAECEDQWQQGVDLGRETVLIVDGAQTLGLKQLERVLAAVDRARAKAVLLADVDKLQALRVQSPFRDVLRGATPVDLAETGL